MTNFLKVSTAAILVLAATTPAFAQMDCEREARVVINKMHPTTSADPLQGDTAKAERVTNYTTLGYVACKSGAHEIARQHFDRALEQAGGMRGDQAG
jgi:hypothetical protein